jgi:hypothetical protein
VVRLMTLRSATPCALTRRPNTVVEAATRQCLVIKVSPYTATQGLSSYTVYVRLYSFTFYQRARLMLAHHCVKRQKHMAPRLLLIGRSSTTLLRIRLHRVGVHSSLGHPPESLHGGRGTNRADPRYCSRSLKLTLVAAAFACSFVGTLASMILYISLISLDRLQHHLLYCLPGPS